MVENTSTYVLYGQADFVTWPKKMATKEIEGGGPDRQRGQANVDYLIYTVKAFNFEKT